MSNSSGSNKKGDPPSGLGSGGSSGAGGSDVADGKKNSSGAAGGGAAGSGGSKGSGNSGDKKWWCPKCGDPCTHVDTFVCKSTCSTFVNFCTCRKYFNNLF